MSASEVRANYEQLSAVARRFEASSQLNQQMIQRIQQSMSRLRSTWEGKGSSAFFREMDSQVLPGLKRLHVALAQASKATTKIQNVLQTAEQEAAALFKGEGNGGNAEGNPGAGTPATGGGGNAPAQQQMTMAQLFDRVVKGNDGGDPNAPYSPVTIRQIGPNEYVVEIAGTKANSWTGKNGWLSALVTGMSPSSSYYNDILGMVNKLPPGATIHLAGHSQGGHDAMFLAKDSGLLAKYNIANVITFGASTTGKQYNNESQYHNYMINTDVLGLAHDTIGSSILPGGNILGPLSLPLGAAVAGSAYLNAKFPTQIGNSIQSGLQQAYQWLRPFDVKNEYLTPLQANPMNSHGDYGNHPQMQSTQVPFTISQNPVIVDQMHLPSVQDNSLGQWVKDTWSSNVSKWFGWGN